MLRLLTSAKSFRKSVDNVIGVKRGDDRLRLRWPFFFREFRHALADTHGIDAVPQRVEFINRYGPRKIFWSKARDLCRLHFPVDSNDAVIFTAGVGENSADLRLRFVEGLDFMGISIDPEKNNFRGQERIVSPEGSPVKVLVIPTNEELMIAKDTAELVG